MFRWLGRCAAHPETPVCRNVACTVGSADRLVHAGQWPRGGAAASRFNLIDHPEGVGVVMIGQYLSNVRMDRENCKPRPPVGTVWVRSPV